MSLDIYIFVHILEHFEIHAHTQLLSKGEGGSVLYFFQLNGWDLHVYHCKKGDLRTIPGYETEVTSQYCHCG